MADEKEIFKDNKEGETPAYDKDVETLLNILREKDNLIVSLKEASTRRDKLNEQQIKMLAEDNAKKLMEIKSLQAKLKEVEAKFAQKEAELSLFKITEEKLSSRVEAFRAEFERYRAQVRSSIDQIKLAIQEELTKREEYKNKILDEMKNNYLKIEAQLQELDNYYKEIIADISKKQGLAKKYIRHALNDLQEALSLLDIAHAEFIQPTKIKEDYSKLIEESNKLFDEFKEMKELPGGTTIIRNIENVNIKLSSAPQIEAIFEEVQHITKSAQEYIEKRAKGIISGEEMQTSEKGLPADEKKGLDSSEKTSTAQDKEVSTGGKGLDDSGGVGKEGSEGIIGKKEASAYNKSSESSKETEKEKAEGGNGKESSAKESGKISPDERVNTDDDEKKKKKMNEDDVHEVIFKRGRNYAPFNWEAILSDIQLKRFQSFIESCIKAEKEGNYLKALKLYKTIREQPGIAETIAGKLLDDHIEYLEDIVKRKYSVNYQNK
jgi:hypothetical protein